VVGGQEVPIGEFEDVEYWLCINPFHVDRGYSDVPVG
jgi:hypothetical protein